MKQMTSQVWRHRQSGDMLFLDLCNQRGWRQFLCPTRMQDRVKFALEKGDTVTVWYDIQSNIIKVKAGQVYPGSTEPSGVVIQ